MSEKLAYNMNEAAAALGCTRDDLRKFVRRGELKAFKWQGLHLIRADVLHEFKRRPPVVKLPEPPPAPAPPVPACGVYLLILGGQVAYVGRSTRLRSRLAQHRSSGRAFDEVRVIECAAEVAHWLEGELVRTLQPPQNVIRFKRRARAAAKSQRGLTLQ